MNELLRDLYSHHAWADAEHWKVIESLSSALEDEAIRKRLHHYHLTQHAFLAVVRGESLVIKKLEDFAEINALKEYAIQFHKEIAVFLQSATDDTLSKVVTIPWFRNPPISITILQALTQAAMHSHYHRGQNATRIRELVGTPPTTDFIFWLWKGKPIAEWK